MSRHLLVIAALAAAACSSKAPVGKESPRVTPDVAVAVASSPAATPAVAAPPDPREAMLSAAVLRLLEDGHLLHKRIDDEVSRIAFASYLERLDGSKMYLLRSDADALAKYADKIDDELRSGSLELAHEGAKIYAARVATIDGMVKSLLAAPLNHADEEWLELDPKKVDFAANEQELRDRWRRRLELEVLERVSQMETRLAAQAEAKQAGEKAPGTKPGAKPAAKKPPAAAPETPAAPGVPVQATETPALPEDKSAIPPTFEGREAKARADLAKQYEGRFARLRTPAPLDAAADLVNGVASVLDPHTTYLPPADKANFDIALTGSLEGIGAVLRERDHYIEIVEIVPGGASARQGQLSAGDLILSVAAEGAEPIDTLDMRIDDVVKMIRGPKGTVVRLRVQKAAGNQESIAITRDVVVVEETYARGAVLQKKGGPAYGYIYLPSFYGGKGAGQRTAAHDVGRLLGAMKTRKVAGVVIDIRGNGGGLLGDAIEITGDLIDQGPVVQVQDSRGQRDILSDEKPGTEYDGKVIVLVDRFSASASEIVAGALQDYGRAIVVGTGPTHGKGTVQTLADLDRATGGRIELGSLKVTIQQFFRVTGSSTQREGVTPDILLPDSAAYIETGERELDHAIAWSKIAAAQYDKLPVTWNIDVLAKRSAGRVAKHPFLAKVATTTAVLKARRENTRVPLARPAWEARRKEQRAEIEAATVDLRTAPAAFTVQVVEDPAAGASGPVAATPAAATPGKTAATPGKTAPSAARPDDRLSRWRDNLARDPWVDECLNILTDAK